MKTLKLIDVVISFVLSFIYEIKLFVPEYQTWLYGLDYSSIQRNSKYIPFHHILCTTNLAHIQTGFSNFFLYYWWRLVQKYTTNITFICIALGFFQGKHHWLRKNHLKYFETSQTLVLAIFFLLQKIPFRLHALCKHLVVISLSIHKNAFLHKENVELFQKQHSYWNCTVNQISKIETYIRF